MPEATTAMDFTADVVIVGAGPVGLTLAMDLASRGIGVAVVERRAHDDLPSVKCNHVSSRSMEVFRRLGVAEALRNAGLPEDFPNDVAFRTSVRGIELSRIPIPCRRDRRSDTSGPDGWWPTSEPPHRINQRYLEPILQAHALRMPGLTIHYLTEALEVTQDAQGTLLIVGDLASGQRRALRSRYLVGCDGGSSMVRKGAGASLSGTPVIQRVQSTYIRAPGLLQQLCVPPAWCVYAINTRRCGTVFAIDGHETWLVHNHLNADEPEFDTVDRHASIRNILGVDSEFAYDVISQEDWIGRRLVADRIRNGRIFLAGDAAHLWVPYAGYGMNAGIADAANLAWLLAASVQGWAGPGLLDAYEAERLPITEQVSHYAMEHAQKMMRARKAVPSDIEAPGEAGDAVRAQAGRDAYELNVQQFCCAGLNFGYYYANSPLIFADGEEAPGYSMGDFTPSTVPGCRAPHFMLADGRSLYDAFGAGYTLLRFDRDADISALQREAHAQNLPLHILDLSAAAAPQIYRHRLVVCRSDQHVAWRGDALPSDIGGLVSRLCGNHHPGTGGHGQA